VEAIESALTCYSSLQHLDDDCLYGILAGFPQMYYLGALVKLFVEQGQISLAQRMVSHIKNICNYVKPDLDTVSFLFYLFYFRLHELIIFDL